MLLLDSPSFLVLLVVLIAMGLLPLLGIVDVWSKQRFASLRARVLWTVALFIAGLPALVVYVIVVKRSSQPTAALT